MHNHLDLFPVLAFFFVCVYLHNLVHRRGTSFTFWFLRMLQYSGQVSLKGTILQQKIKKKEKNKSEK